MQPLQHPASPSAALQPLCPTMNKPDGAFSQRTTMEVGVGNPAPKYPVHNFIPSYPTCQLYPTAELSYEIRLSRNSLMLQRCAFRAWRETNPSLPTAVGHRCASAWPFPDPYCACFRAAGEPQACMCTVCQDSSAQGAREGPEG